MRQPICLILFFLFVLLPSCREDEVVVPTLRVFVDDAAAASSPVRGLYLLCEGNMGSNKATIDFLDFHSGVYERNIYAERNPQAVKELGDVGNDIQLHGSRLYVLVNCSNKMEVMDARTCRTLGRVDIPNCRNVAFHGGKAYVSSYVGPVAPNSPASVLGEVWKVDTASLCVEARVAVGYQPEEMAVLDGRLYVANSGGYMAPDFDDRLTVVDLDRFEVEGHIRVAPNLHRVRADHRGRLWVTSRGDNKRQPANLWLIEDAAREGGPVVRQLDIPVSDIALRGDSLFYICAPWGADSFGGGRLPASAYGVLNTVSLRQCGTFISDGTEQQIVMPYGVALHPATGDVYVADARNYVSSGTLYCFSPSGSLKWTVKTGDIPAHFCFLNK